MNERYKIFMEYKISEEHHESYLMLLPTLRERMLRLGAGDYMVYTGLGQPGLFVEECTVDSVEVFDAIKKARLQLADAPFDNLLDYIPGGAAKCHMWLFQPIDF
jgi:hypothetical protein